MMVQDRRASQQQPFQQQVQNALQRANDMQSAQCRLEKIRDRFVARLQQMTLDVGYCVDSDHDCFLLKNPNSEDVMRALGFRRDGALGSATTSIMDELSAAVTTVLEQESYGFYCKTVTDPSKLKVHRVFVNREGDVVSLIRYSYHIRLGLMGTITAPRARLRNQLAENLESILAPVQLGDDMERARAEGSGIHASS